MSKKRERKLEIFEMTVYLERVGFFMHASTRPYIAKGDAARLVRIQKDTNSIVASTG